MEEPQVRSDEEIGRLKGERVGIWRYIRWAHRRRPFLTAVIVVAALILAMLTRAEPADLLDPAGSWRFWVGWTLLFVGFAVRLWGAGNLRKNQEITNTGVYALIRHPLYFGSLCHLLAYFLTIGSPGAGLAFFTGLLALVYLPTMLAEEEHLRLKFTTQYERYRPPPRVLPDIRRLPEAARTDRFELGGAYRNLGFRSAWIFLVLPLLLEGLRWLNRA